MATPTSLLEETLEAWRATRQGVIEELKNIPAEKMDFRPTPEVRTVRELVQHTLEGSLMMTGELARPDAGPLRASREKLVKLYALPARRAKTKAALLALLASQMRDAERKFRTVGELALLQLVTGLDGRPGTKLGWLRESIAHEMYHRGQLALYARLMGLAPAPGKPKEGGHAGG